MGADGTTRGDAEPAVLYSERLLELKSAQASDQRQERQFGYAKVAVAFVTIAAALILLYYVKFLWRRLLPSWQCCMSSAFNGFDYDSARLSSTNAASRGFRIAGQELGRPVRGSSIRRIHMRGIWISLGRPHSLSFFVRHAPGRARKHWLHGCSRRPQSKRSLPDTAPFTI